MDARVKGRFGVAGWSSHGGGAGAGRPARRQRRLVTLRCAGRDRMTVSGRELPRTSDASLRMSVRDRIEAVEVPHGVGASRPAPAWIAQSLRSSGGVDHLLRLLVEGLPGHGRPEEAAELAGDGDGGDGGQLSVADEVAVAIVEADLRLPGARERLGRDEPLVRPDAGGEARRVLVVPGRLDEQAAGVAVAGLGERAAGAPLAGGVLADGEPEEAHQLARRGEAAEVADLGEQAERGQGGDAAEAAQPAHRVTPGLAAGDLVQLAVEGGDLGVDRVQVAEHVLEGGLGERVVEPLPAQPGPMPQRPRLRPFAVDAAVAQQLLADA